MTRGRGYSRGSYRGSSRGGSTWTRGGYIPRGGGRNFNSFSGSFDSRSKYGPSDRYSGSRGHDVFRKSYRMVIFIIRVYLRINIVKWNSGNKRILHIIDSSLFLLLCTTQTQTHIVIWFMLPIGIWITIQVGLIENIKSLDRYISITSALALESVEFERSEDYEHISLCLITNLQLLEPQN